MPRHTGTTTVYRLEHRSTGSGPYTHDGDVSYTHFPSFPSPWSEVLQTHGLGSSEGDALNHFMGLDHRYALASLSDMRHVFQRMSDDSGDWVIRAYHVTDWFALPRQILFLVAGAIIVGEHNPRDYIDAVVRVPPPLH